MCKGWKKTSLGSLTNVLRRGIAPMYCDQGVLVLNQKCIREQRLEIVQARRHDSTKRTIQNELNLRLGDVLVNSTGVGTLGRVAQVKFLPEILTIDSHVTLLRANPDQIDLNYFGWAIREKQSYIQMLGEGSTGQTELSRTKLAQIEINIPSLNEQKTIAEILGHLDDKIELNRQMNITLEEMAQTLFKSWFVDFDPVHEQVQGRTPAGMSDEMAALFPNSFQKSDLGLVPSGWKVSKLGDYIQFIKGRKPKNVCELSSIAPHLLIATFDGRALEMVSTKNMVLADFDDVLMVMDGASSGRTEIGFNGVVGSTIAKIVIEKNLKHFLYFLLKRHESEINAQTTGTSIPHTNKELVFRIPFCLPANEILDIFNRQSKSIRDKINLNKKESNSLTSLRDILLPKLLSGEISVGSAEQQVSQAL